MKVVRGMVVVTVGQEMFARLAMEFYPSYIHVVLALFPLLPPLMITSAVLAALRVTIARDGALLPSPALVLLALDL